MSLTQKYICQVNNKQYVEFEYNIITQTCWIIDMFMDVDSLRPFFILLESSFSDLQTKGIKTFVQNVGLDELDAFLNLDKCWNIVDDSNDEYITIDCDINLASICMAKGLGFNI